MTFRVRVVVPSVRRCERIACDDICHTAVGRTAVGTDRAVLSDIACVGVGQLGVPTARNTGRAEEQGNKAPRFSRPHRPLPLVVHVACFSSANAATPPHAAEVALPWPAAHPAVDEPTTVTQRAPGCRARCPFFAIRDLSNGVRFFAGESTDHRENYRAK